MLVKLYTPKEISAQVKILAHDAFSIRIYKKDLNKRLAIKFNIINVFFFFAKLPFILFRERICRN